MKMRSFLENNQIIDYTVLVLIVKLLIIVT